MNERDALFLNHVVNAIADIESFTTDGRDSFMADRKTQSAVMRQLEIIGEAVKKPPGHPGPGRCANRSFGSVHHHGAAVARRGD